MAPPDTGHARPPGIAESGDHLVRAARDWANAVAQLATLEVRYSLRSALMAGAAALLLCATLFAGWALLLVALSLALVHAGLSWWGALLAISVVNIGLAVSLWLVITRFIAQIGLDATRRVLGLKTEMAHERPARPHTAG